METTRLSSKGQIVLPSSIRTAKSWEPGTEFTVEATEDGVLIRPKACFPPTTLDQVVGILQTAHKTKTPAQMRKAIEQEIRRRHESGRY